MDVMLLQLDHTCVCGRDETLEQMKHCMCVRVRVSVCVGGGGSVA